MKTVISLLLCAIVVLGIVHHRLVGEDRNAIIRLKSAYAELRANEGIRNRCARISWNSTCVAEEKRFADQKANEIAHGE